MNQCIEIWEIVPYSTHPTLEIQSGQATSKIEMKTKKYTQRQLDLLVNDDQLLRQRAKRKPASCVVNQVLYRIIAEPIC